MVDNMKKLKLQYDQKKLLYEKFCKEIKAQLFELLHQEGIALAFPIESRVKLWESILSKYNHSKIIPKVLEEISDIAGIRIILLFRRDQEKVCRIISDNFNVIKTENTLDRLSVDQFGYGSVHFEVTPKEEWFSVPTLRTLRDLAAEIQVRTASQHIWAAASHTLQYKRERHVPNRVRRSINLVAALLELVDREFERVLVDRGAYVAELDRIKGDEPLNTDILQKILADEFPLKNLNDKGEDFVDLLEELIAFGILNARSLQELIKKHRKTIFSKEKEAVEDIGREGRQSRYSYNLERVAKGVFYTQTGLLRQGLREEFGKKYDEYLNTKFLREHKMK